jgi:hypothetical protein
MAIPSYLASLNGPFTKERSEAVSHWTSKTKAGEQLTVWLGIEPDFVDKFVLHRSVLLHEPPFRKRRSDATGSYYVWKLLAMPG